MSQKIKVYWVFRFALEDDSVIRLGDFCKFLFKNYLLKVAQRFGDFWGILKT